MDVGLNSLMKSFDFINRKKSPYFIINKKLSEINNLSSLLNRYSKDIYQSNIIKSTPKSKRKNRKSELSNISFSQSNKRINKNKNHSSIIYLLKNKSSNLLQKKSNAIKNGLLRKYIFKNNKKKILISIKIIKKF